MIRTWKILNIISHQQIVNWNHNEISLHTTWIAKIKKSDPTKCWWGSEQIDISFSASEYKMAQPLWKKYLGIS